MTEESKEPKVSPDVPVKEKVKKTPLVARKPRVIKDLALEEDATIYFKSSDGAFE